MPQPISRFPLPDSLDALPADLRERVQIEVVVPPCHQRGRA